MAGVPGVVVTRMAMVAGVMVRSVLLMMTMRKRSCREGEDEREERQHAEPSSTAARLSPGDS
jgi:hypothetical protein